MNTQTLEAVPAPLTKSERTELEELRAGNEDYRLDTEMQLEFDKRSAVELICQLRKLNPEVHECEMVQMMFCSMVDDAMAPDRLGNFGNGRYCLPLFDILSHHLKANGLWHHYLEAEHDAATPSERKAA